MIQQAFQLGFVAHFFLNQYNAIAVEDNSEVCSRGRLQRFEVILATSKLKKSSIS
jgi:hypothetical protein